MIIACLSNPVAIVYAPVFFFYARSHRNAPNVAINMMIGLLILIYYLSVYLNPSGIDNIGSGYSTAAKAYVDRLMENPTYSSLAPIVASVALIALCVAVTSSSKFGPLLRRAMYGLAYVGLSSMLLYLASSRFLAFATWDPPMRTIPLRHSAIIVVAAFLGAILFSSTLRQGGDDRSWQPSSSRLSLHGSRGTRLYGAIETRACGSSASTPQN
jgi:hypothetical protein